MPVRFWIAFILTFTAAAQDGTAPVIVQPGAPGKSSTVLTPAAAAIKPKATSPADAEFMQGMIHHHSQAVEMVALMRARTHNQALLKLGERISISQTDEIRFMKQWLTEHGEAVPGGHDMAHMNHAGMDMSSMNMDSMKMDSMPLMPGMLTPKQMAALAKASGPKFDHLFLTGMIQHHTGALTMVEDLFNTPGAAQDAPIFDFATDIENTQTAEINIMKGMLLKEKK